MKLKFTLYIIIKTVITFLLIVIISSHYILNIREYYENSENNDPSPPEPPSIHVLLATMGKDSIFTILESFKKQLNKSDYLTIVFDGPDLPNVEKVKEYVSNFNAKTNVIVEKKNLGYWGHAIRNKHNTLTGDFVFHVDDDDNITPGAMDKIRKKCTDKDTIYIFKMQNNENILWKKKEIRHTNIGTPMGIIPTKLNSTSVFTYKYGGDYDFYKKLEKDGNKIEFVDYIIYKIKNM